MLQKKWILSIGFIVILAVTLPYFYAFLSSNSELVFGGFLINPIDGHSYLAKMQQGYRGEWKFVLPYSADQGEGAYLFLFYLFLGHIARLIGMPLLLVFHISRLVMGIFLMWTIWLELKYLFKEWDDRILGFSINLLGAGLGWIAILFGKFSSDFWVSEAYPFLSMYTNPHFPFGLGLMILGLINKEKIPSPIYLILGLLLGVVQPFGVVILCLILAGEIIVEFLSATGTLFFRIKHNKTILKLVYIGLGGGSVLVYQYWIILTDPILSLWNEQNVTTSPGILDILISFSPCFILAVLGIKKAWKTEGGRKLVLWIVICLGLVFVPWNLQRRFLTGLYVPLAGLTVFGLEVVLKAVNLNRRTLVFVLFLLIIPTNLVVVFSGINAVSIKDSQIFIETPVIKALEWIENNSANRSLILAGEREGLIIPSMTGRRVVYGHPYETTNAEQEQLFVKKFFNGELTKKEIEQNLRLKNVDFVFSRSSNIRINEILLEMKNVKEFEDVGIVIFKVE